MRIPFSIDQFLDVFRQYNLAVSPAQWALYALGLMAVALVVRGTRGAGRLISGILALLWLWMGAVYHVAFFRRINPAATLFGAVFIGEAIAIARVGAWQGRLAFRARRDAGRLLAWALVAYALVLYPLVGLALGHRYPAAPTFGLPCPTTIFTMGLLALVTPRPPAALLVVPLAWAAVGTSAAMQLGMREDFGLLAAALVALGILLARAGMPQRAAADRA